MPDDRDSVAQPAPLFCPSCGSDRYLVHRDGCTDWQIPVVPLLVLPGVEWSGAGHCVSCNVRLAQGREWRCATCLAAVERALALRTA